MGIPSYFSNILKKYNNIIKKKVSNINDLYIDANSIIYKSYNNFFYTNKKDEIELFIINETISYIEYLIKNINPIDNVIIAFDGVVPLAKMKQQRERRFKSFFLEELLKNSNENNENNDRVKWDKTQITPGTDFMNLICNVINNHINNTNLNCRKELNIYLSSSNEYGEGEHKIFELIEQNNKIKLKNRNICIYGLDADLLVLSLLHQNEYNNIYLFREFEDYMNEFIVNKREKFNIDTCDNKNIINEFIFIEISKFKIGLFNNIKDYLTKKSIISLEKKYKNDLQEKLIKDYVFLTFFLGNDFMPHIPCLNIRSDGIEHLINYYSIYLDNNKELLLITNSNNSNSNNNIKIKWKNLKKLLGIIKEDEKDLLIKEIQILNNIRQRSYKNNNLEKKNKLQIPINNELRDSENYINPRNNNWEKRYYEILFNVSLYNQEINDDTQSKIIKDFCINYYEGLEWNLNYYMNNNNNNFIKNINNIWCYQYNYAPLITDIYKYMPIFDESFIKKQIIKILPETQLFFVISYNSIEILNKKLKELYLSFFKLREKKNKNIQYNDFIFVFCKYLWEGHLILDYELNNINDIININNLIFKIKTLDNN